MLVGWYSHQVVAHYVGLYNKKIMSVTPEVDFGPLAGLIGVWQGDKGMDKSPDPDGTEENPYFETIDFTAGGDLGNTESQVLWGVYYPPFLQKNAKTIAFRQKLNLNNGKMTFPETTMLDIYGRNFEHTDENLLNLP